MKVKAKIESLNYKEGYIDISEELLYKLKKINEPLLFSINFQNKEVVALYNDISKEIVVFDSLLVSNYK